MANYGVKKIGMGERPKDIADKECERHSQMNHRNGFQRQNPMPSNHVASIIKLPYISRISLGQKSSQGGDYLSKTKDGY